MYNRTHLTKSAYSNVIVRYIDNPALCKVVSVELNNKIRD